MLLLAVSEELGEVVEATEEVKEVEERSSASMVSLSSEGRFGGLATGRGVTGWDATSEKVGK